MTVLPPLTVTRPETARSGPLPSFFSDTAAAAAALSRGSPLALRTGSLNVSTTFTSALPVLVPSAGANVTVGAAVSTVKVALARATALPCSSSTAFAASVAV